MSLGIDYQKIVRAWKTARPCWDCGESFPYYVMIPDHVHGRKAFDLSRAGRNGHETVPAGLIGSGAHRVAARPTLEELYAELAKCEPVCANCHAIRGHERSKAHREGRCECPA